MTEETEKLLKLQLPLNLPIIVTSKKGNPAIELRRLTTDLDIIKAIVECAFNNQPFLVLPSFSNKINSLSSLIDKGILYLDEKDGQYKFTF